MALFFVVKPIPPDQIDRSSRGAWLPRHDRYQDGPLFESAGGYYTLRDRPEVVLSNNDGCCVARSAEAKALGIRRGQPFFEVRDRLAQHQGRALSSNDALHGDMSSRLMQVIGPFRPEQEVYASDESFLRFTPVFGLYLDADRRALAFYKSSASPTAGRSKPCSSYAPKTKRREKGAK